MSEIYTNSYVESLLSHTIPTPCFVTDLRQIKRNVAILDSVQKNTHAKILLALKAFSQWGTFDSISRTQNGALYGVCASSPDEARLAKEEFGGEVHAFAAAYSDEDMQDLLTVCDHIVFNSVEQYLHFKPLLKKTSILCGLRINPEHSEGATALYNPCHPSSRLGVRKKNLDLAIEKYGESLFTAATGDNKDNGGRISGLHFHTLCEQNADALARTLDVIEKKFSHLFPKIQWINFGGGHHITRDDYDIELLCSCINRMKEKYNLDIYLEPGEAVALNAGVFVSTVLDIVETDMPTAILDCSATCHMPDVLEMPYRPNIIGAGENGEKAYSYRLAGKSCLAGDSISEYSFDAPLKRGDKLVFQDMAIYSMVKTTTFNGLRLPHIATWNPDDPDQENALHIIRSFTYQDFKMRLS